MDPIERIPQKPPFRFIDEMVERGSNYIITKKNVGDEEDFFQGHFPGNPVMPGVLMCEACFQSAALLLTYLGEDFQGKLAVVSRIQNAKFKNMVLPGDELEIKVELKEMMGNAAFMKGVASAGGKKALIIEFSVALTEAK